MTIEILNLIIFLVSVAFLFILAASELKLKNKINLNRHPININYHLQLQKKFQTLAGQFQEKIPSIEVRILRLKLALEELNELAHAYGLVSSFNNIQKLKSEENQEDDTYIYNELAALDAVVDIAVINNGTIITQCHENIFDNAYIDVTENNLLKFKKNEEEARAEFIQRSNIHKEDIKLCINIYNNEIYYSLKNNAGKILKYKDHPKVDLSQYVK